MTARTGRAILLCIALGGSMLAACVPPPPLPGPSVWCANADGVPDANDYSAVVDRGGSAPEVVEFDANTQLAVDQQVAALERSGDVLSVSKSQPVQALVSPGDDDLYSADWGFAPGEADFPGAWATGADGTGVKVAVIDTGVQGNHPDLAPNVVAGADFTLTNPANSNYGQIDGHGHGTHVAGTIAARDNVDGVVGGAPNATIVPVRVLNCEGSGDVSGVTAGIYWAADPLRGNVDVINMSLGTVFPPKTTELADAVQHAIDQGVVVVAAAGNSASGAAKSYPAAYPGVIAVRAKTAKPVGVDLAPAGGYVETPDSAVNSIAGNLDIVALVQPASWTPVSAQVIASKINSTTLSGYEPLKLDTDGRLVFSAYSGGVLQTVKSAAPVGEPNGTAVWLRVRRVGTAVTFEKRTVNGSNGEVWFNLGASGTIAATPFTDSSVAFRVGDSPADDAPFDGNILWVEIQDAAADALSVMAPSQAPNLGSTSWVASTGEAWTLTAPATLAAGAASYSNWGSYVAVVAPGSAVVSTYSANAATACTNVAPGYCSLSGTSMASPHVAAVAALLLDRCPGITVAQVRTRITTTDAAPVAGFAPGIGLLKAGAATSAC